MRPEQNTTLNAKTEKFIIANISGNTLKQGSSTQCSVSEVHICKNTVQAGT